MDNKDWIKLFGRDSEDGAIKDALAQVGVKRVPAIKKDETDTRVMLSDAMLIFSAGELFPSRDSGGDGSSILSCLVLPLKDHKWGEYKGELPFELNRTDSQKTLRARFGEPVEQEEDFFWDQWNVDDLVLRVSYTEDLASLADVSVELPNEI